MKLIKRSGQSEEFQIEKVLNSITAASDASRQNLSESAIKRIGADVMNIIGEKESVESWQVAVIVSGLLYRNGFLDVLEQYSSYK